MPRADPRPDRHPEAYLTIGELAAELGVAAHVLRFWETRFPELRPLQRGGGRRYYRPADAALARALARRLHGEGYTVKGVQRLFAEGGRPAVMGEAIAPAAAGPAALRPALSALRARLARALSDIGDEPPQRADGEPEAQRQESSSPDGGA